MPKESNLEFKVGIFVLLAFIGLTFFIFSVNDSSVFEEGQNVKVVFGFDYQHQAIITDVIPQKLDAMLNEKLSAEGYDKNIINIKYSDWNIREKLLGYHINIALKNLINPGKKSLNVLNVF